MNKQSLTTQSNKALGQTGHTPVIILNNKPVEVVLVGIALNPQGLQIVSQPQAPQQSTTINVQNVQVNNYNCPPPEVPKPEHSGSSRDAHIQRPQTTASGNRGDEDKPHGVKNKSTAPNTKQNQQEKTQNGSEDKVNSSRTSQVQPPQIQNKSGVDPVAKHTTAQAPSKLSKDGQKNFASATVSPSQVQVQKQVHKEGTQPKKSIVESLIASLSHSDSNHKNGSQHKGNAPNSATIPPARSSIDNHQSGSGKSPTVNQPAGQDHLRPARHNGQAPTPMRPHAPHNPAVRTCHGGSRPTRRGQTVGVSHSHTPVNKSKNERAGTVPDAKELNDKDIRKHLDQLDSLIGKYRSKTSSGPARLILVGKASAEMMGLKINENAYHIDVVLDLQPTDERLVQIRQCMKQVGVFREFLKPEVDAKKDSQSFFRTGQHRAEVFKDVAREGKCVSNGDHLKVYIMNTKHAFEFELRRWDDPDSDERTQATIINIAAAIWQGDSALRNELTSRSSWRNLKKEDPINRVLTLCNPGKRHE